MLHPFLPKSGGRGFFFDLIWGWSKDNKAQPYGCFVNPASYTYYMLIIMRKEIMCECNETTWYDENGGTVAFVDAIRYVMSICKCGVKE
tara:strand:+ start:603 stop:869 length:267 start_codon:yes stop_codon:yes gene_type:complete